MGLSVRPLALGKNCQTGVVIVDKCFLRKKCFMDPLYRYGNGNLENKIDKISAYLLFKEALIV